MLADRNDGTGATGSGNKTILFGKAPWKIQLAGGLHPMKGRSSAALVYLAIVGHTRRENSWSSWPSHRTLAEITGLAERTVYDAVAFLQKIGLIETQPGGGKLSTMYTLTTDPRRLPGLASRSGERGSRRRRRASEGGLLPFEEMSRPAPTPAETGSGDPCRLAQGTPAEAGSGEETTEEIDEERGRMERVSQSPDSIPPDTTTNHRSTSRPDAPGRLEQKPLWQLWVEWERTATVPDSPRSPHEIVDRLARELDRDPIVIRGERQSGRDFLRRTLACIIQDHTPYRSHISAGKYLRRLWRWCRAHDCQPEELPLKSQMQALDALTDEEIAEHARAVARENPSLAGEDPATNPRLRAAIARRLSTHQKAACTVGAEGR
jgi:DNA-binding transcriptional MocR family regulator